MPRIARIVALDYPHHVTQRGTNRSEIFLADRDRLFMLECLKTSADKTLTEILAYCLTNGIKGLFKKDSRQAGMTFN